MTGRPTDVLTDVLTGEPTCAEAPDTPQPPTARVPRPRPVLRGSALRQGSPVSAAALQTTGPSVCVVLPTYDEAENVERAVTAVLDLRRTDLPVRSLTVMVVDDASPDGTGALADALARRLPGQVSVVHRAGKEGLGRAYADGFARALAAGADVVVQMDADGSHPISALPRMLEQLRDPRVGVVVGSRYVAGGSIDTAWGAHRRMLSAGANAYVAGVLGMGVRDATAGFKAWRADALRDVDAASVRSRGYAFQVETTWRALRAGWAVREEPIHFTDRERGVSKMSVAVAREAALLPWRLRLRPRRGRSVSPARRPDAPR